jgi:hypothetical protein
MAHPAAAVIPFGAARLPTDPGAPVRGFRAAPGSGPLRLSSGVIGIDGAAGVPSADDRFAALHTRVLTLSDPWSRSMHAFVDAYFAFVTDEIARSRQTIAARLAAYHGLYRPEDLRFAAWLPLPQAHLPTAGGHQPVPFAFWSGTTVFAVDLGDGRGGVSVGDTVPPTEAISVDRQLLEADPVAAIRACLPAEAVRFWDGVEIPTAPSSTDPATLVLAS